MSKTPSPIVSFVPIIAMVAMLYVAVSSFGSDALSGPSQVVLLVASALTVAIGMAVYKIEWARFENAIVDNIKGIASATIILLIIGALSGAWMLSGVVPTLIDYGMAVINPRFFLATACIICILVSVMTGSSWTTIATIGIALMGIGQAQGYSDGWIAGAIISGAYFGDKISPLSDTTVLAASVSHTPLFDHIRYMLYTTIPSIVITLIIFVVAGITGDVAESSQIDRISAVLNARFNITPWLLIVPIVTGVLIARRVPTLITLFASTVMAVIAAVIAQPDILASLGHGDRPVFEGAMKMLTTETSISSGNALVDDLISTRGMAGMLNTVWLILCAMCFGGTMTASGMLRSITAMFARMMKSTFSLVSSTVCSGLFLNLTTADQYISIILTGNMFRNIYEREGYESRLLSRTTEDSVTVTSVLVPWNSCGMTQSTVLGVPTLTYLPYCFFNYLSPIMSMIVAAFSYKIYRKATGKQ
ncbi:MAG: Na+/H+ antiporter NhaC family protein [Candidatus Limisoma sp.]|nr:Na+/H+ antiporter NhaC family protein [Bacteroidales bacterium]MDD7759302.1 Na+/H+ antiporter NhaC family protein [Bacteroidales bacterium]MDY5894710.1 Na+/H+ antiporter NhaC family protein [Candidatus Limisoma sp.]